MNTVVTSDIFFFVFTATMSTGAGLFCVESIRR